MTTVYRMWSEEDFDQLLPLDEGRITEFFDRLHGLYEGGTWPAIKHKVVNRDKDGRPWAPADAPWIGADELALRPTAQRVLGRLLLLGGCRLLPLDCDGEDIVIVHPPIVDALNEAESTITRFRSPATSAGKIMTIDRYVFHSNVARNVPLFRIPNVHRRQLFFGDIFVDLWYKSGLRGARFESLWSG